MDDEGWPSFLSHIKGMELDYHWFIADWVSCRADTRIWTALDHGMLAGAMLLFKGRVCQIRGGRSAAAAFMDILGDGVMEVVLPRDCGDLVKDRFNVKRSEDIILMHLEKGKERLVQTGEPVRLGPTDVDDIIKLMRGADPLNWGEMTTGGINSWVTGGVWYGQRDEGRLVAVAGSWFLGEAKMVNIVAVDEHHRGRGLAKSVLSRLLFDIFQASGMALIHVRADNEPAIRAYRAVGYLPCAEYRRILISH